MTYKPVDTAIVMVVGPCIDDTDFKTLEEAIAYDAAGMDVSLIVEKTDGTTAVTAITLTTAGTSDWTHKDGGYYEIEITAAQNAEEGIAYVRGVCTGVLPFESIHYNVVKANVYDSWIKGTDVLQTDVTQWLGTAAATPTVAGVPEVDITHMAGGVQTVTDLKDFADAGYDPATNKVQGVVLVDTTTTNTDRAVITTTVSTSNTANSFTCTAGAAVASAYKGMIIEVTDAGDGNTETRRLDAWTSGRVVIVDRDFSFIPAVDDVVRILPNYGDINVQAISGDPTAANNAELAFDGTGYGFTNCTMPTVTTLTGHTAQTGDSFARIGATGSALTSLAQASVCTDTRLAELAAANIPADIDTLLTRVTAAVALASVCTEARLSELDAANLPTDLSDIQGATFVSATDSLEAIRDRGDAAWTTGAGGSDRLLMVDTTIATLTSQTSFTLAAGSADDNAYNNCTIVIEDVSTATQKAVGIISAYTGATKTVTLKYDPAIFTMETTDKVYILAENALKSALANRQLDVSATGKTEANVTQWLGTAVTANVAGQPTVDVTRLNAQTAPLIDLVDFASNGYDSINNVVFSDLVYIHGSALSESVAGYLAAAFVKLFDVATPVLVASDVMRGTEGAYTGTPPTAAAIVNEWETQSQADPTGFHVNVKEVNGTAQTANDNSADINEILLDTAVIGALGAGLTAVPWNSAWDAEVESEVNDGLVAFFTSAVQLVDDIWDELLTGATHNIATSAGRRVRELGAYFITGGTAQAGTAYGITLAAGESAIDHIFNRNMIVIFAGTGAGQTRTIVDYDGTSKIAVVDRNWWVNPDNTSEYSVIPDDTPLVADHGQAQAGTNNTITLRSDASAIDSTYTDIIIFIMAGTGAGQTRLIDSYVGATKVATIHRTWTTNPDATSVYAMIAGGQSHVEDITAVALAKIKTQADTALTDIKLDHLIAVADGDDPVDNSIIAMIAASDGDWSGFAIADDSLEAIRDQGDAAWITGAGGSPPTTLQNTTIASLATQVSFTLTAGSADDDAYNGCIVVVEDSATATQKCIGRVLDYTGASKTITLEADPGVFTMAAGDTIDVIAVELTWNAATKALTDKSGFALSAAGIDAFLDEVIGDAVHATPNSVGAMLHAVYCRFMQKRTATDSVEKAYKLDDVTELKSFTLADDDTTTSRT